MAGISFLLPTLPLYVLIGRCIAYFVLECRITYKKQTNLSWPPSAGTVRDPDTCTMVTWDARDVETVENAGTGLHGMKIMQRISEKQKQKKNGHCIEGKNRASGHSPAFKHHYLVIPSFDFNRKSKCIDNHLPSTDTAVL